MRNLHLAPKFENIYFYTTEDFGVKNKNPAFLKTFEKQEIQTFDLEKIFWHMYSLIS